MWMDVTDAREMKNASVIFFLDARFYFVFGVECMACWFLTRLLLAWLRRNSELGRTSMGIRGLELSFWLPFGPFGRKRTREVLRV